MVGGQVKSTTSGGEMMMMTAQNINTQKKKPCVEVKCEIAL